MTESLNSDAAYRALPALDAEVLDSTVENGKLVRWIRLDGEDGIYEINLDTVIAGLELEGRGRIGGSPEDRNDR